MCIFTSTVTVPFILLLYLNRYLAVFILLHFRHYLSLYHFVSSILSNNIDEVLSPTWLWMKLNLCAFEPNCRQGDIGWCDKCDSMEGSQSEVPQMLWCDSAQTFKRSWAHSHAEHHIQMGTRLNEILSLDERGEIICGFRTMCDTIYMKKHGSK